MSDSQDLAILDDLARDVAIMVAPVMAMVVADFGTADAAIRACQEVKDWAKRIEKARTDYVAPLNARVKATNERAKEIAHPLTEAEAYLKQQLVRFEREQERLRAEARAIAQKEAEERARALAASQEAERLAHEEALLAFGVENEVESEAELARLEDIQIAEASALKNEIAERDWNISRQGVSNTRKGWAVECVDIDQVPIAYQKREINSAMLLAAKKANPRLEIPGVRFSETHTVAIGRNTRVPR